MFKKIALASSLFASLALAACAPTSQPQGDLAFQQTDANNVGKADHLSLSFTPIQVHIDHDLRVSGGHAIVTSAESFEDYFGVPAPSDIDFEHEWVAFYGSGARSTGGFSAAITGISILPSWYGSGLLMETADKSPGSDCFVTMAITTPHMLVRFERPQIMPEWFTTSGTSEQVSCAPDPQDLQVDLAVSRQAWELQADDAGHNYTWTDEYTGFSGYSTRTRVVVRNGVPTERHYKAQHMDGGPTDGWVEVGPDELHTHTQGTEAVPMETLYDECKTEILTLDPNEYSISLSFDDRGLLSNCSAFPKLCMDDCSFGPRVSELVFDEVTSCECGPLPLFQPMICDDGTMLFPSSECVDDSFGSCSWDHSMPTCDL